MNCVWVPPATKLKVLFTSIRRRDCAVLAGKIKIGNGVTLRNHIACIRGMLWPVEGTFSFSIRRVKYTTPVLYADSATRDNSSSDVDLSHNHLRTTVSASRNLESKQGGSHGKSHQECYIGERFCATESVEPDSPRLLRQCKPTVALSSCK